MESQLRLGALPQSIQTMKAFTKLSKDVHTVVGARGLKQFALLTILVVISGLWQAMIVSSVPIFFSVALQGPSAKSMFKLPLGPQFSSGISIERLSLLIFAFVVVGGLLSIATTLAGNIIAMKQTPRISSQLLAHYLEQPYEWHLGENSSALSKRVLSDVPVIIQQIVLKGINLISKGFDIIVICAVLFIAKPIVAFAAVGLFGLLYGTLILVANTYVRKQGRIAFLANQGRFRSTKEALGSLKLVKVHQCTDPFVLRFRHSAERMIDADIRMANFASLPKPMLETLVLGGVFVGIAALSSRGWSLNAIVPLLGLYSAAAVRLLPAAQQCYLSFNTMLGSLPCLETVADDLRRPTSPKRSGLEASEDNSTTSAIDLTYRYPSAEQPSIQGISFAIESGQKVGLVGRTGAGKTTLVDIILGLLTPTAGSIKIASTGGADDRASLVGYVPQEISFVDGTFSANIAIGIPKEEVELERLQRAARDAQILDFIESLPSKFETELGEDGVRLSGGQRQRIGIARALYRSPTLLVLDEASSALDAETERDVFESLFANNSLTIIAIAHRLSVLKKCDKILFLQGGKLQKAGSYDELRESEAAFRALTGEFEQEVQQPIEPTNPLPERRRESS